MKGKAIDCGRWAVRHGEENDQTCWTRWELQFPPSVTTGEKQLEIVVVGCRWIECPLVGDLAMGDG